MVNVVLPYNNFTYLIMIRAIYTSIYVYVCIFNSYFKIIISIMYIWFYNLLKFKI